MADSVYWIWLQLVFGIGTRRAELAMSYFDHPGQLYEEIRQNGRAADMLSEKERLAAPQAMARAEEILRVTLKKGCRVITPDDALYPARLQGIFSRPAALYVKGDLTCLKESLCIAMVGTRRHTEYGANAARMLAGDLARCGAVVVSGLADGVDRISHQAALDSGGKTVGVLGCGIDVDYPKGTAALKRQMCENGAVVTEYPLGATPYPSNFPIRNRIISGMCQGTLVVEADSRSGSLITANHALEQGRDVFAVPGSIFSDREQGTHQLLREGAVLVESARDIFAEYPQFAIGAPMAAPKTETERPETRESPPEKRPVPEPASETAKRLYQVFGDHRLSSEEIAAHSGMDMSEIQSALTELELFDVIQAYPGRQFGLK